MAPRRRGEEGGGGVVQYVFVVALLAGGFLVGYTSTESYDAPAAFVEGDSAEGRTPAGSTFRPPLTAGDRAIARLAAAAEKKKTSFLESAAKALRGSGDAAARGRPSDAVPRVATPYDAATYPLKWGPIPERFEEHAPDCARATPAPGYPKKLPVSEIVANWNPDSGRWIPERMYETLCRFDYATELDKAFAWRDAEVPFQLYNVPEMTAVAEKWADPEHLRKKLGKSHKYKCEASNPGGDVNNGANHFMYTNGRAAKNPPITNVKLSWDDWLQKVEEGKNKSIFEPNSRFYFRFSAQSPSDSESGWIFKELPFFQPRPTIMFVDHKQQRGIHCRFGMEGIIAEAHWDGSRNMVAQFYGRRRYILVDPDDSCDMYLLNKNHPSGRHSEVDWSNPDSWGDYPRFPGMPAHEVVQRPGDFLYLPTFYLHYIISIDANYQCNTRSGKDNRQSEVVNRCTPGFEKAPKAKGSSKKGKKRAAR